MPRDMHHDHVVVPAIYPVAALSSAAPAYVEDIDLTGYEGALIVIQCGDVTASSLVLYVDESDDGTTYGHAAAGVLLGDLDAGANCVTITATTDDNAIKTISYIGDKKYIQLATKTGTMSGFIAATVVKGHARRGQTS